MSVYIAGEEVCNGAKHQECACQTDACPATATTTQQPPGKHTSGERIIWHGYGISCFQTLFELLCPPWVVDVHIVKVVPPLELFSSLNDSMCKVTRMFSVKEASYFSVYQSVNLTHQFLPDPQFPTDGLSNNGWLWRSSFTITVGKHGQNYF